MTDVTCDAPSSSTLTVSWSPPTSPVLSYQVEVRRYAVVNEAVDTVTLADPFDQQDIVTSATLSGLGTYASL